ncbi:MAG: hypothetical protein WBG73_14650 [Coleofasciculaceae cyanobacterium]
MVLCLRHYTGVVVLVVDQVQRFPEQLKRSHPIINYYFVVPTGNS